MDSGAFSLWAKHVGDIKNTRSYGYYKSPEFRQYVDAYAKFIKANLDTIDYYANVDVLYDPQCSWDTQKYLEAEHGLKPVPVIHYGEPIKWLDKYLEDGYDYIGIGGMAQIKIASLYAEWIDGIFRRICPAPTYMPIVKTHGFAITGYKLLRRCPWYSVDSASWTKAGANGTVYVPHKRNDKFTFDVAPYTLRFSDKAPSDGKDHFRGLGPVAKQVLLDWLAEINIPLGRRNADGSVAENGVTTRHSERKAANLFFFERMRASLPPYPWPLPIAQRHPDRMGLKI